MGQIEEQAQAKRATGARLGLMALAVLQPWLGLWRLAEYRIAGALMLAPVALLATAVGVFALPVTLAFGPWLVIVGLVLLAVVMIYLAGFYLTWVKSDRVRQRPGRLWRWYGVAGALLLYILASTLIPDDFRFRYRTFSIPAESMAPNLVVGDLFVAKMDAGQRWHRGDVVVVRNDGVFYVKRVVAIPGDRVAMTGGRLLLNGAEIGLRRLGTYTHSRNGQAVTATLYEERLPGEARAHRIIDEGQTLQDKWDGVALGSGQYVLLGDNRDNSLDSRMRREDGGFGVVDGTAILGTALFRFWRGGVGLGNGAV